MTGAGQHRKTASTVKLKKQELKLHPPDILPRLFCALTFLLAVAAVERAHPSSESSSRSFATTSIRAKIDDECASVTHYPPADHHDWRADVGNPAIFNSKDPTLSRASSDSLPVCNSATTRSGGDCASTSTRPKGDPNVCQGSDGGKGPQRNQVYEGSKSQGTVTADRTPREPCRLPSVSRKKLSSHHREVVRVDGDQPESPLSDTGHQECSGSLEAKRSFVSSQKSTTNFAGRVSETSFHGAPQGPSHGNINVAVSLEAHGHPKGYTLPTLSEGHCSPSVGELQVGPVRHAGSCEVHRDSQAVPRGPCHHRAGNLPRGVQRVEEGGPHLERAFYPTSGSDSPGGGRVLHGRDSASYWTHPHGGPSPRSEAVHRSKPQPEGVKASDKNVSSSCSDFPSRNLEEIPLPQFMITSKLNIPYIYDDSSLLPSPPSSVLSKAKNSLPLEHPFELTPLVFTESEWEYLCGDDKEPEIILSNITESSGGRKKLGFSINGKRCETRPSRGPCNLPLASITEKKINYSTLLSLPVSPTDEHLDAMSWIVTDRLKLLVMNHPELTTVREKFNHHVSRHVMEDMGYLHDLGVMERRSFSPWTIEVPLFKVPKSGGEVSRLIGDCRGVNQLIPKQGPMGLPNLPRLIRDLLSQRVLYQLDARSYFYAFSMSDDASEVFGARWGNKRGIFSTSQWRVMPQGFSLAPRIAQFTSLHLAANAAHKLNFNLTFVPWIDNFLAGTQDHVSMSTLIESFNDICQKCNVDLKPPDQPPGQTLDALGIHFDVSAPAIDDHFVELQPQFRDKMLEDSALIRDTMTPREYFQIFGSCMWANYAIARFPLCQWPEALATVRKIAMGIHSDGSQEKWDEPVTVGHLAASELRSMSETLRNSKRTLRDIQEVASNSDIFTDASSWAWGYLQTSPGMSGLHRTHAIRDIFVAELLAACDAWNSRANKVPNLYVDNTAAVGALLKGHSSSGRGNLILSRLYKNLPSGAKARVTTVPTDCQRADLLSRGVLRAGPLCEHKHVSEQVGWIVLKE